MLTARERLILFTEALTEAECETALDLLAEHFITGPKCPDCGELDMDLLEWQMDGDCDDAAYAEFVACATCGFCWNPNEGGAIAL